MHEKLEKRVKGITEVFKQTRFNFQSAMCWAHSRLFEESIDCASLFSGQICRRSFWLSIEIKCSCNVMKVAVIIKKSIYIRQKKTTICLGNVSQWSPRLAMMPKSISWQALWEVRDVFCKKGLCSSLIGGVLRICSSVTTRTCTDSKISRNRESKDARKVSSHSD